MSSIKRERSSISGILSQLSCVDAPNREKCLALRVQNVPKENALHPASVQPGYSAENSKSTLSYPIWKRLSLVSMGAEHHGMIRTRKLAVPISSLTQLDLGSPGSSQTLSSCSGPTWTFSHLDLLSRLDNFPDVQSFKDLRETEKTFVDHLVFCKIVALELDLPILQAVCQLLDIHIKLEKKLEVTPDNEIVQFLHSWGKEFRESYHSYIDLYGFGVDLVYDSKNVEVRARINRILMGVSLAPSRLGPLDWLFKRPLVRMRYYTRLCKSVCPDHPLYELFRQLVHLARDKITAEKERVNDFPELSTLDTSKACELGSLAPTTSDLKKSLADKSIKSMAKFRMSMVHVSTGRVLQSPVEIVVLHDSILIVNRESHQRYLMFSPILGANICVSTQNETAKVFELLISGKQRIEFSSESPVETWVVHIRECCKNAVTEHKDNLRIPPDTVEELSTTPKSSTFPRPPHRTPNRGTVKPLQPGEPVDFSSPRLEPSRYPTRRAPSPDRSRLAPPSLLPHISPSEPPQLPLLEFGLKSLLSSDSSRSLPHSALERPSVPRSRTSGSPNRKNIAPSESERKQGIKSENSRSRQACQTLCFIAAVAFFWREGDWRRLVSGSTAVTIRHDVGHGVMQVMHIDTGDMLVNADMLPTNSVKRVDLTSVSIGCDIGSNKELYLFRAGTSKEADLLLQSLNMTKLALTPMPLESQPPMSWTAAPRKLSFGSSSSLASYSTASTNVTVPSFVNQQSLPALSSSAVMLSEEKIKIFLRIDAGMWKTLGTARLQFHGTSEAKASHLIIVTGKKQNNKSVTIIDASLRETACERVGKTGVMLSVMNGSRIVTWMVQGKNDDEAKKLLERIKAGKHI